VRIRVRDPGRGVAVTLEVDRDEKLSRVKEEACLALGLRPEVYVVLRAGRALPDRVSVGEAGVSEGEELTLMLRSVWEALVGQGGGPPGPD